MHVHIAINNTYDTFEVALFKGYTLIDKVSEDKRHTSKLFIPLLQQLLSKNEISFAELSFCSVNCGPGPFSTLRSIIASANGLRCATGIPLVSVDGLEATFLEFYDASYESTVVLLNAFNNESYYLIAYEEEIMSTGYKNTELLMQDIQRPLLAGDSINIISGKQSSVENIGWLGYEKFRAGQPLQDYLVPLHLKKHAVERSNKE
jgi:tRNA threonylcarbamoyladenosine biosynthesis protein TsaB